MKLHATLAALAAGAALAGCGVIYTAPAVYESGAVGGASSQPAVDVQVIPMTFETALEANIDGYVPARLPASFQGSDTPLPGRVGLGADAYATMPEVGDLANAADVSSVGTDESKLPPTATSLTPPPVDDTVNLPPPSEPEPYRIGVSDVILLSTNNAGATLEDVPSLLSAQAARQGYVVQDDGAIAVPDVGRVQIAGMTLEEAEAQIFEALVAQRLDPSFSLEIAEFNSQRVSVGGDVRNPMVEPITLKPLKLSESLQFAGGVNPKNLNYAVVRLFRDGKVYQVPVRDIYGPEAMRDVILKDGDAVFVDASYDIDQARAYFEEQLRLRQAEMSEREFAFRKQQAEIDKVRFGITLAQFEITKAQLKQQAAQMRIQLANYDMARNAEIRSAAQDKRSVFKDRLELGAVKRDLIFVTGEVREPRTMPLPFETTSTLAEMLFQNRGLDITVSDYSEIYVLRQRLTPQAPGSVNAYHLNAANAVNLTTAALFEMRPNDIIFVTTQPVTSWSRVINQLTPSLLTQAASLSSID